MGITRGKTLWLVLFFALVIVRLRGEKESNGTVQSQENATLTKKVEKSSKTYNEVVVDEKRRNRGGGNSGGGGFAWGWGGGAGGGGRRGGGWGWGGGGGGGVSWQWDCKKQPGKRGEFAQCMFSRRCRGMRLDCPLHCGGPCFYDSVHMCKAHCKH
ncbi:hypothetical protein CDL12_05596 [Handroanthus impetiginosus]|uniref:Uncharacterized protein n=1 Tax=Handroanthus impetiginosus TaxID=429701 RepID=A0A2G9HWH2_9LAMI|nr:hypothetical protein CDL12_05596 [Handroanthus impetiginosus]